MPVLVSKLAKQSPVQSYTKYIHTLTLHSLKNQTISKHIMEQTYSLLLAGTGTGDLPEVPHLHINAFIYKQNPYLPILIFILRTQQNKCHLSYYVTLTYIILYLCEKSSLQRLQMYQAASKQFLYLHMTVQVSSVIKALVSHRQYCLF